MADSFVIYEEDYNGGYSNPMCKTIDDCGAVAQGSEDTWGDMMAFAVAQGCSSEEDWKLAYSVVEGEWVDRRRVHGEHPKTSRTGKIVAKGTFPDLWNTYKSNISKALRLGVSLVDDNGNYMRRSALSKKYKEIEATTGSKLSDYEKAKKLLTTTIPVLYSRCGMADKLALDSLMQDIITGR